MDLSELKNKDIATRLKTCCEILGITEDELHSINDKRTIHAYKNKLYYKVSQIKDEDFLRSKAYHQGPDGYCASWVSSESYPYPDKGCFTCMNFSKQDYEKALEAYNG